MLSCAVKSDGPAPAARAPARLMALAHTLLAASAAPRLAWPGGPMHRAGRTLSCPDVARSDAPGPAVHHILVVLGFLWWCLVLADAGCWVLVAEVRSGPHTRAGSLGSFSVDIALVQFLLLPWAASASCSLVSPPAVIHPCPMGNTSAAVPMARAAVRLADSRQSITARWSPMAGALVSSCTATSSPARTGTPLGSERIAGAGGHRRAPLAYAAANGNPRLTASHYVKRLSARDIAVPPCVPASAEASSQIGRGVGGGRKPGGRDTPRRRTRAMNITMQEGRGRGAVMSIPFAARAKETASGEAVGAVEVTGRPTFATASTASAADMKGSGNVGVAGISTRSGFAATSTLRRAARKKGRPRPMFLG